MKNSKYFSRIVAMLAGLVMAGGVVSNASAAGVASGTTVSNSASVNYQVGSIPQTQIDSAAATFVVDTKIDLTVATVDGATVKVTPGATDQVLEFSVTNTGNATQDFSLSQTALSSGTGNANFGGDDNFDATYVGIFVEDGTTVGYQPAEDTATYIDELAADGVETVYIVVNIALTQVNGDISSHHLLATAGVGGAAATEGAAVTEDSGTADDKDVVQIVFGDSQGSDTANDIAEDGKYSSQDDYEVQSATLSITKASTVISDPFSATNPKRIPGAVVEYTITIDNSTGAVDATNIVLTDLLDTTNLTFSDSAAYSGNDIELNINSGTITTYTGTDADDDGGDFGVSTANTITVDYNAAGTGFTVPATQSATVKFRVTIN